MEERKIEYGLFFFRFSLLGGLIYVYVYIFRMEVYIHIYSGLQVFFCSFLLDFKACNNKSKNIFFPFCCQAVTCVCVRGGALAQSEYN